MAVPKFFIVNLFIQPITGGPIDEVKAVGFDQTEWERALAANREWPRPDETNGQMWMMTFLAWHAADREKIVNEMSFHEFRRTYQVTTAEEPVEAVDPTIRDLGTG